MAITGVLTNQGLQETLEAQNNEGWYIYPEEFGVSATKGDLDPSRTETNSVWYRNTISSRVVQSANTIEFICTVPPDSSGGVEVNEIYLFAKNQVGEQFLLAIFQPAAVIPYSLASSLTFRLILTLSNVEIGTLYEFKYTQATEISEHNNDPNAHPDFHDMLEDYGIYMHASDVNFRGQTVDRFATFDSSVSDKDLVYKSTSDNTYYKALADGSEKSVGVGIADTVNNTVMFIGLVDTDLTYSSGTDIFLSDSTAGEFTNNSTPLQIGQMINDSGLALINVGTGGSSEGDVYRNKLTLESPRQITVVDGYGSVVPCRYTVEDGAELVVEDNACFMIV